MNDLRAVIDAIRCDGRQRTVRCPGHDDRRASLSVGLGSNGRVLLHCQAGCSLEGAVLPAAGLTMNDLSPDQKTAKKKIIETYRYEDEHGWHLFDVVRFEPKDFRQRRADGQWSMRKTRRTLYRLRELFSERPRTTYIVEGEKDVERLRALGLVATTNPGGAGKWRQDFTDQLVCAGVQHIDILPDNDESGRKHAATVAESCRASGLTVQITELPGLPAKGDISDWLDAGNTKKELQALVTRNALHPTEAIAAIPESRQARRARERRAAKLPESSTSFELTTIGDLLSEPEEAVDWLVEGLIPAGGVCLVAAKPKTGKSTTARDLALAHARGENWLGRTCAEGLVWYLAFEGRRRDVRAHFRQMGATAGDALRVFVGQAPRDVVLKVRELAAKERPTLIIIDTMQRFLRAQSTDDYAEMTALLDSVIGIAEQSGATILLLHHSGKADRASLDAVLGSTAITGSADTIILLARSERYRTIATVQRVGDDLPETILLLDEATGRVSLGPSRQTAEETFVAAAIMAALQNANAPLTEAQLDGLVDARTEKKRRVLRSLVSREHVNRIGRGGKGDPYRYSISCSRSHVPNYMGEQENNNPHPTISGPESVSDSCSPVSEQDSCSRERLEL